MGACLVAGGFFHVAAALLGRWRILEVLLKLVTLVFAGLAAMFFAGGVVDELILKPLLLVPGDRLEAGQTVPAHPSGSSRGNEPSDGSGAPLGSAFNVVVGLGTVVSTISALAAGWGFVLIRVRNILKHLKQ
jgi:hypothetical protein